MSASPRISVITPTFNRLALLRETIASVEAQTCGVWEHLVVDDGSDDGTEAFVLELAARDPRVRYFRRVSERRGANVCRNIGLREARGEFVVFLDSDDLLQAHCLAGRLAIMERNQDLDFAVFGSSAFRERPGDLPGEAINDPYGDALLRFLCFDTPWIITGPVWRKAVLERLGGLDEALPSWQDVDLHIRAITSGARFLRLSGIDHDIRWQFEHEKVSILQRRSMDHLRAAITMFAGFEDAVRKGPGMDWSRQRAICGLYFFVCELMVHAGTLRDALANWKIARSRGLATVGLARAGAVMLVLASTSLLGKGMTGRILNKWKGWVRFRMNPELVADGQSGRAGNVQ